MVFVLYYAYYELGEHAVPQQFNAISGGIHLSPIRNVSLRFATKMTTWEVA